MNNYGIAGEKVRGFIALSRPFTLLAPAIGVISGGTLALAYYNQVTVEQLSTNLPAILSRPDILLLIFAGLVFALINTASNAFNQVTDLDIDRINKPERPIPSGTVTKNEALVFSIVLYAITMIFSVLIGTMFLVFVSMFILITILYSVPPLRLKQRLWVSNIAIAVARSWLLLLAGWSIFSFVNLFEPTIWFIGLILFAFLLGSASTKDFTDIEGDKRYGMRTLPVVYGTQRSVRYIAPFFVLPFLLIPVGVLLGFISNISLALVPLVVWGLYVVSSMKRMSKEHGKRLENSPLWAHMYLMLITLQAGFFAVYLF